jgi:serine/threonine protein phosphatase PrpC
MLWIGQFGIVEGEARERTPWVGAFVDRSLGDDAADLYVVVEPALPGSEEFCGGLTEAIGNVFHQRRTSLTGALLRALKAAHSDLHEWNRRSLKEHWVAAGVSCLALRAHEAYLAQVGPASAVLYHQGSGSPLALHPTIPDAVEPLGLHDDFWPHFSRLELAEGDRLLLLSPTLAGALSPQELVAALDAPPDEALPALYRQARSLTNCGALLVAILPDPSP